VEVETALIVVCIHDVVKLRDKSGLAVSRETHHLILVSIFREAEKLGKRGIENSERMREGDGAFQLDFVSPSDTPHDAAEIPKTIDRDNGSFIEWRAKECAGQMSAMMLDKMKFSFWRADSSRTKSIRCSDCLNVVPGASEQPIPIAGLCYHAPQLAAEVRSRIARYCNMIRLFTIETRLPRTDR